MALPVLVAVGDAYSETVADARAVVAQYRLALPPAVARALLRHPEVQLEGLM